MQILIMIKGLISSSQLNNGNKLLQIGFPVKKKKSKIWRTENNFPCVIALGVVLFKCNLNSVALGDRINTLKGHRNKG